MFRKMLLKRCSVKDDHETLKTIKKNYIHRCNVNYDLRYSYDM